ncbi:MAG: PH domain-containing protein [Kineosporiaceae bacterium]
MGFPSKLLSPGERLVLVLRPHAKVLIAPVLVLLVTAPVTAYLAGLVPEGSAQAWMRLALAMVGLVVVGRWTLWPFLTWWNTVYAITDRRLVLREGVFNRTGHDMPLSRLNDVKFSHNVIERVLGCGTLVVESAGEIGQLVLDDIPRVEQVQRTLYRLSDELRGVVDDSVVDEFEEFDELVDGAGPGADPDSGAENATKVLRRGRRRGLT